MLRTVLMLWASCLIAFSTTAHAEPLHKLAIIDVVIEGDLSDASRQSTWPYRLDSLTRHLREGLAEDGTYQVVSMADAAEAIAKNKSRASIHLCPPCLKEIADSVGADRILAARVFRVSNLVMFLQLWIINPATGDPVASKNYTFRGDNDLAWIRSAEYVIDDLKELPESSR